MSFDPVFGLNGIWFVAAGLLRNLAALHMEEMMAWDYWALRAIFAPVLRSLRSGSLASATSSMRLLASVPSTKTLDASVPSTPGQHRNARCSASRTGSRLM